MKLTCKICGDQFDATEGKRGKKPTVCTSSICRAEAQRQSMEKWKANKKDHKPEDTSKGGWPADTKKCQRCGKLFISDSKSRVCPVCLADGPLPKQLDESLIKAKEAGFDPVDYGKYKAAKTLAGLEPIDVGLANKMDETKKAIDGLSPKYVIVDQLYHSDPIGNVVSTKTTKQGFKATVKTKSPAKEVIEKIFVPDSKCDTCKPTSNHDFICALEDLMEMADKWHMDPDKVYPLAEDILKKGIMKHTDEAGR